MQVLTFHSILFNTVSAERVDGSTPGARVSWSTAAPPECVASVTVDFRTSISGSVVRSNTTTSTSQTEVIQTGLQCFTTYYITVTVTGVHSIGTLKNDKVHVLVGGKITTCAYGDQILRFGYPLTGSKI